MVQEAEKLLGELTRSEKAQLLQWIVRDLGEAFPGILKADMLNSRSRCGIERSTKHEARILCPSPDFLPLAFFERRTKHDEPRTKNET